MAAVYPTPRQINISVPRSSSLQRFAPARLSPIARYRLVSFAVRLREPCIEFLAYEARFFSFFSFLFYEIERRGNFRRGGERGEEGRILRDPRFRFATVKTRSYNFQCSCDVSACRYFSGQVISSFSFFFLSLFSFSSHASTNE